MTRKKFPFDDVSIWLRRVGAGKAACNYDVIGTSMVQISLITFSNRVVKDKL